MEGLDYFPGLVWSLYDGNSLLKPVGSEKGLRLIYVHNASYLPQNRRNITSYLPRGPHSIPLTYAA
jgi:hypothetical protein